MRTAARLAIDRTIDLDVNGSRHRTRLCAERDGLPPLLIVQGGPGLPLLNEVSKYQRLLDLERDFLTCYWEQRGCGDAPSSETKAVSMQQQVADLRTVLRWFFEETKQRVTVLAVSMGGAFALQAAEHEPERIRALVVVSPDSQTTTADAAADAFIRTYGAQSTRAGTRKRAMAFQRPPIVTPAAFQQRLRLLTDFGAIERGKTFGALLRESLLGMTRTYGVLGAIRTLRNMNRIQRVMLPQVDELDLFAKPPRIAVPVHYVFGEKDALNPPALVNRLPPAIGAPSTKVTIVPDAGHMVHFDHPDIVRSIVTGA